MKYNIALVPGDGIGPEIVGAAVDALKIVADKFGHDRPVFLISYVDRLDPDPYHILMRADPCGRHILLQTGNETSFRRPEKKQRDDQRSR